MIKNIAIAVLIGIVIGQTCKADSTSNNSITRKDLFAAAALCGIISNPKTNPMGWKPFMLVRNKLRSQDQFVEGANYYADNLIKATTDEK